MSDRGWDFGGEFPSAGGEGGTLHERVQAGPEFTTLRRRLRGFVFPMTAAFLLFYVAFVLLASYAREWMATPVYGGITVGLVIGLAQFASTFALTAGYVRYAGRRLDPLAAQIREQIEGPEPVDGAFDAAPAGPEVLGTVPAGRGPVAYVPAGYVPAGHGPAEHRPAGRRPAEHGSVAAGDVQPVGSAR